MKDGALLLGRISVVSTMKKSSMETIKNLCCLSIFPASLLAGFLYLFWVEEYQRKQTEKDLQEKLNKIK